MEVSPDHFPHFTWLCHCCFHLPKPESNLTPQMAMWDVSLPDTPSREDRAGAQHSTISHSLTQHGVSWHTTLWHSLFQHSTAWHRKSGTVWHKQHTMARHCTTQCSVSLQSTTQQCRAWHSTSWHSTSSSPLHPTIWTHPISIPCCPDQHRDFVLEPVMPWSPMDLHSRPAATACPTYGKTDTAAKPKPSLCQTPLQA